MTTTELEGITEPDAAAGVVPAKASGLLEQRRVIYGLVCFMTFLWGINFVMAKLALRFFPALLIGPLRACFAALFMLPIYFLHKRRQGASATPWTWSEVPLIAVLGICGITLNQIFFVSGISQTSVAHGALVIALSPVMVLLLAALRGQEKITARAFGGMMLAFSGVAALNLGPGKAAQGATFLGDILVFFAGFTFALFAVFSKEITLRHDTVTVNTLGYAAGAIAGLPLIWWEALKFDLTAVPLEGWLWLVYLAAFPSILGYLIFYHAITYLPASRVTSFSYAQPVIAALTGLVVLGEPITMTVALGGALVLAGVWMTSRR